MASWPLFKIFWIYRIEDRVYRHVIYKKCADFLSADAILHTTQENIKKLIFSLFVLQIITSFTIHTFSRLWPPESSWKVLKSRKKCKSDLFYLYWKSSRIITSKVQIKKNYFIINSGCPESIVNYTDTGRVFAFDKIGGGLAVDNAHVGEGFSIDKNWRFPWDEHINCAVIAFD